MQVVDQEVDRCAEAGAEVEEPAEERLEAEAALVTVDVEVQEEDRREGVDSVEAEAEAEGAIPTLQGLLVFVGVDRSLHDWRIAFTNGGKYPRMTLLDFCRYLHHHIFIFTLT